MKKHILMSMLSLALLAAGHHASAQDKEKTDDKNSYAVEESHYKGDYHCYRAWRKDMKIKRKEYQAEVLGHYRPWAADRKLRSAHRKAWRRDMLEHEHRTGRYDHDWWTGGGRNYWY